MDIKNTFKKIKEMKSRSYEIKDENLKEAKSHYEELMRLLESVPLSDRLKNLVEMIESEYIANSKLGDIYFFEKLEVKALKYYRKSKISLEALNYRKLIKNFNFIGIRNDILLNIGLCTVNIALKKLEEVLNLSDEKYLQLKVIKEELLEINPTYLTEERKSLLNNTLSKIDGIERKDIYLEVDLQLPFPLMISPKEKVEFEYCNIYYEATFDLIQTNLTGFQVQGCASIIEDKYGLLNRSKVKLKSKEYVDLSDSKDILEKSIRVVNYIISHYKLISKEYLLEEVNSKMITNFSYVQKIGEVKLPYMTTGDGNTFRIGSYHKWLENNDELIKSLNTGDIETWRSLYCDSKNNYSIGKFKEAILTLNIAFESFVETKIKPLIISKVGQEDGKLFFEGKLYEDFHLKDYISEENFIAMLADGKSGGIPNVGKIIKKAARLEIIKNITNAQIDKKIKKIRKHRNDISHGRELDSNLLGEASKKAIEEFEKFIDLL